MRIIKSEFLKEGDKLGTSIKTPEGNVILAADTLLTATHISRMSGFNIRHLYIEDESYSGVTFRPSISDDTRILMIETMNRVFTAVKAKKSFSPGIITRATKELISDIYKTLIDDPVSLFNLFAVKDPRVSHAINVASIVAAVAIANECPGPIVDDAVTAALLHDILLEKMDDDTDYVAHPAETAEFIKELRSFSVRIYRGIGAHHEKFDGSGFPRNLSGDMITEIARMIAIADMFDNLTNGYGCAKSDIEYTAEHLTAEAGQSLDPDLVGVFNNVVAIYPTGVTVKLNNGLHAVVVGQNRQMPGRPQVRIVSDSYEDRVTLNMASQTNATLFVESVEL
jgi:HD-GYP domain-containing protein (c-di-GMP phosphodiesterase class II)